MRRIVITALFVCTTATVAMTAAAQEPRTTTSVARDAVIHLGVFVPIDPQRTFDYFVTADSLAQWLTQSARVEPRVGGAYELMWNPTDPDNDSTIGCRITALTPGQVIAFQWRGPRQFKALTNAADPLTHVTVAFVAEQGGTRIHVVHSGWRSTPEWDAARRWQAAAWEGALDVLRRRVTPRGVP